MKPLAMILVFGLIGVVVAGIVLRFVGGGDDTDGPSGKPTLAPDSVLVTLFSSSTKRDWLNQVVEQFNSEGKRAATGETIVVAILITEWNSIRSGPSSWL